LQSDESKAQSADSSKAYGRPKDLIVLSNAHVFFSNLPDIEKDNALRKELSVTAVQFVVRIGSIYSVGNCVRR